MFKINGIWWKLYFVSPNDPMLFRSDGSLTLGACDNEINTIFINKELDEELFKKVLCHEIVHAAMFSYGVKLSLCISFDSIYVLLIIGLRPSLVSRKSFPL